jgi:hypothetical protein
MPKQVSKKECGRTATEKSNTNRSGSLACSNASIAVLLPAQIVVSSGEGVRFS